MNTFAGMAISKIKSSFTGTSSSGNIFTQHRTSVHLSAAIIYVIFEPLGSFDLLLVQKRGEKVFFWLHGCVIYAILKEVVDTSRRYKMMSLVMILIIETSRPFLRANMQTTIIIVFFAFLLMRQKKY